MGWVLHSTPCLPPHPPHPFKSVGHKKLPAWVQEEELLYYGITNHDSLVLTGDLGHLMVVDSYLGLVGGEAVESCGRCGRGPMPGQGPLRMAVATALGDGRDKVDLGFPGLRKEEAAWGSGWVPSWALSLTP